MSDWKSAKEAIRQAVISCDTSVFGETNVFWADDGADMAEVQVQLAVIAAPQVGRRMVKTENMSGTHDLEISQVYDATVQIQVQSEDEGDALFYHGQIMNGLEFKAARNILTAENVKRIDFVLSSQRVDVSAKDYGIPTFVSDAIFRLEINRADPNADDVIETVNGSGPVEDVDGSTVETINISETRP